MTIKSPAKKNSDLVERFIKNAEEELNRNKICTLKMAWTSLLSKEQTDFSFLSFVDAFREQQYLLSCYYTDSVRYSKEETDKQEVEQCSAFCRMVLAWRDSVVHLICKGMFEKLKAAF